MNHEMCIAHVLLKALLTAHLRRESKRTVELSAAVPRAVELKFVSYFVLSHRAGRVFFSSEIQV